MRTQRATLVKYQTSSNPNIYLNWNSNKNYMNHQAQIKLGILACIFTIIFLVSSAVSNDLSEFVHIPDNLELDHCEGVDCVNSLTK